VGVEFGEGQKNQGKKLLEEAEVVHVTNVLKKEV